MEAANLAYWIEQVPVFNIIQLGLVVLGGIGIWSLRSSKSTKKSKKAGTLSVAGLHNEGNTCFMNSVVQSIISLPILVTYLETRLQHDDTTAFVTDALLQLSSRLALCKESNTYRTIDLVQALGSHGNRNLFTYQQQDAQEFFQLVSSMITKEEILKSKPTMRDILLSENDTIPFLFDGKKRFMNDIKMSRNPFTGLLASRISCLKCGHQSAWRHDTFDNLSITVPSDPGCKLEKLIKGYTAPEFIHGYICEKCSIVATAKRLQAELAEAKKAKNKNSLKQLKEHYHIIQNAIKRQKYDIQLPKELKLTKVEAKTAKQTSIAYAPDCLCLHMQRSMYLPSGHLVKNNSSVAFAPVLDLNDFVIGKSFVKPILETKFPTTNLGMTTQETECKDDNETLTKAPLISEFHLQNVPPLEMTESNGPMFTLDKPKRPFIYQLKAIVLHYGHHESGHFVALRRCQYTIPKGVAKEIWFRVSDATVDRIVDIETEVYQHGSQFCYMLFYEKEHQQGS